MPDIPAPIIATFTGRFCGMAITRTSRWPAPYAGGGGIDG
jgi:hypothetical protein